MYMQVTILTGKRNATIEICHVRYVVHKHELHELTMTRTLSKASGSFEFIDFGLTACWLIYMNILTAVTYFISFRVIYRNFACIVSLACQYIINF